MSKSREKTSSLKRKVIIKIKLRYDTDIVIISEFYITMINILKEPQQN